MSTSIFPADFDPTAIDAVALALIERAVAELSAVPERAQDNTWVSEFAGHIDATPTFAWLRKRYISTGSGGGGAEGVAGRWIVSAIMAGNEPSTIPFGFFEALRINWGCSWLVRPLRGLRVKERHSIAENVFVCPNSEIPETPPKKILFADSVDGPEFRSGWAALVQAREHRRIFLNEQEAQRSGDKTPFASPAPQAEAHAIRLALGLSSPGPVEFGGSYVTNAPGDWLMRGGWGYSPSYPLYYGGEFEPDVDLARSYYEQLKRFRRRESLDLAISRLLQSRHRTNDEDRIIDLGMAAEIMLMHSTGSDGKSEITNKLSTRAGWLLGGSLDERLVASRQMARLYNGRSKIVHSGRADDDLRGSEDEFDRLVTNIATAILNVGRYPDWQLLVLGASSQAPEAR